MALEITSTETEWRFVPDPQPPLPQKGRVVSPVTIYGIVREPGDVVEMDANTYRNLCADGRVEPFTEPDPLAFDEHFAEGLTPAQLRGAEATARTLSDFGPQLEKPELAPNKRYTEGSGVVTEVRRALGRPRKNP